MSFLNSVLSTLGGDGQQAHMPQGIPQPKPTPRADGSNATMVPRTATSRPSAPSVGQKRKAEEALPDVKPKVLKTEKGERQINGVSNSSTAATSEGVTRPSISTTKSALAVPYRGTSRPSPASASPSTPTNDTPKSAPKKGSYAEIMARAAANSKPSIGVIKHKPKEAISAKKEILMRKKGIDPRAKGKMQGTRDRKVDRDSKERLDPKTRNPSEKKPQPSYKGTAAPKPQPTYRGTMRPADSARMKLSQNDRSRSSSTNPPRRRIEYDSEDEDDDIDQEYDSDSINSDNMETGFADVEDEEALAREEAKLDDAMELKLENQRKKEKEERKKKLAAMAAKAPKPKY
ncbi:MAG: hypothetical protein Q9174_001679 [Haloplaca sp. 1 TL-2023]